MQVRDSDRFLGTFSSIERHLRLLTGKGKGESFSSLLNSAAKANRLVDRYSDNLRELADLRNCIVHERTDGHVIAEPNERAVEEIERIAGLLLDPPKVVPFFKTEVCTISLSSPIGEAVKTMYEQSFSQMPVEDGDTCVGLLTADTVTRWLGASVPDEMVLLEQTPVGEVLAHAEDEDTYAFLGKDSTLFDVLEVFERHEKNGKRLDAILITETGKASEALLRIVTAWDLVRIHRALGGPR